MDTEKRDKKYNHWAREIPTYICMAFPFAIFLLVMFQTNKENQDSIQWLITEALLWGSAIFPALFFLLRMLIRDFSSFISEWIFFQWYGCFYLWPQYMYQILLKKGIGISDESYDKIKRVQQRRGLNLDEPDKKKRKRIIKDIVYNIKNSTREDNIVFEYNAFYGFYRNMVGGLIITAILVHFVIRPYLYCNLIKSIEAITCFILVLIVICLVFMYRNDYNYAIKMFHAYLKKLDSE